MIVNLDHAGIMWALEYWEEDGDVDFDERTALAVSVSDPIELACRLEGAKYGQLAEDYRQGRNDERMDERVLAWAECRPDFWPGPDAWDEAIYQHRADEREHARDEAADAAWEATREER